MIDKLSAEVQKVLNEPDLKAKAEAVGIYPVTSTPAEFAAFIQPRGRALARSREEERHAFRLSSDDTSNRSFLPLPSRPAAVAQPHRDSSRRYTELKAALETVLKRALKRNS